MRIRTALLPALAGVALLMIGVTGCGSLPPGSRESPESADTPPAFASIEEARDTAFAVLQRYGELSDQIGSEGGADPARIFEVAETSAWSAEEVETFEDFQRAGIRTEGAVSFSAPRLYQYQEASLLQLYTCVDVSGTRVIDSLGVDVTPAREEKVPYKVTFGITPPTSVVISRIEVWNRADIC